MKTLWLYGGIQWLWTNFYSILTSYPLRINNCGHFSYYQPFVLITKHGISTSSSCPRSYWMPPTTNETLRMFNLTKNCVKCLGGASIGHVPLNSGPTGRLEHPYMLGMICPPAPSLNKGKIPAKSWLGLETGISSWDESQPSLYVPTGLLIRDKSMVMDYLLKVLRLILSQKGL